MSYISKMPFTRVYKLIVKAYRKQMENELWSTYLADRANPHAIHKPFSDYLKKLNKPTVKDSGKSSQELIEWANRIKEQDQASK